MEPVDLLEQHLLGVFVRDVPDHQSCTAVLTAQNPMKTDCEGTVLLWFPDLLPFLSYLGRRGWPLVENHLGLGRHVRRLPELWARHLLIR